MRRIVYSFIFIISMFILVGCGEEMTPKQAVMDYMESYVTLDDSVVTQLNEYVDNDSELNDEQKKIYKEILRKQYSSLTYEVGDERIEGDTAYVKVKINVKDLYKVRKDTNAYYETNKNEFFDEDGVYDVVLFVNYQLNKMKDAVETVDYELELKVIKINNDWDVTQLSVEDLEKIHGIYNYEEE